MRMLATAHDDTDHWGIALEWLDLHGIEFPNGEAPEEFAIHYAQVDCDTFCNPGFYELIGQVDWVYHGQSYALKAD